jgi:hypothetical protein
MSRSAMKMREQTFVEGKRSAPEPEILTRRVNELGLRLEGTVLEVLLRELEYELLAKGIRKVKPRAYLTDEWGCPEGIPIIGIPYYLADERLKRATKEIVEGENESEILKYLRHEMGHVFNYAYRLFAREDWTATFGSYARPYLENYRPQPFSRDYVRHIAGWYAQKHPDEDWSETFAIWLTPTSDWKNRYGAGALKKLEYCDRICAELGGADPVVPQPGGPAPDDGSVDQLTYTVGEYIELFREPRVDVPPLFDGDLKDLFDGRPERKDALPASEFLARRKRTLVKRVVHWTGVGEGAVGSLVEHLIERAAALGLVAEKRRTARRWIDIVAYVTTLCMNHLYVGAFIPGCPSAGTTPASGAPAAAPPTPAAEPGTAASTPAASAPSPPPLSQASVAAHGAVAASAGITAPREATAVTAPAAPTSVVAPSVSDATAGAVAPTVLAGATPPPAASAPAPASAAAPAPPTPHADPTGAAHPPRAPAAEPSRPTA